MTPHPDVPLSEREAELEAVDVSLSAASTGNGRLLLVEGQAGLGKSRLLIEARQRAEDSGLTVMAARGGEFERDVPFGVARELFGRALQATPAGNHQTLFRGAAELAAPLFSPAPQDDGPEPPSSFPVAHGLYWLLANLAERSPLLVTVDDAHWADDASLRFLLYLAERLEGLPVVLVVALRPEDAGAAGQVLARLRALPQARMLQLHPLSRDATAEVIRRYFAESADEFCRAIFDASGGNPFLVREILTALDLEGVSPTAAGAARVRRLALQSVARATATRLAQLRPEARPVAEVAAVLGEDAHLRHVAHLARLDFATAAEAAHELVSAGILRAGEPLQFSHAPVWSAVLDQISPGRRGGLHGEAAALLDDEGADPARLAPHMLQAHPIGDARVVDVLRVAAREAMTVGSPESAVRYLRRALAEPAPSIERPRLLLELGRVEAAIGHPDAVEHLCRAVPLLHDRPARAEALYEIGRTLVHSGQYGEAIDALCQGLEDAGAGASELRRRLLAAMLQATRLVPGSREFDLVDDAEAAATGRSEPGLGALLGELSYEQLLAGNPAHKVRSTAHSALAELEAPTFGPDGLPFYDAVAALTWADDLDAAKAALDQALADGEHHGRLMAVATACFRRAVVSYLQGSIPAAVADAQRTVDAAAHGWATYLPAARGILALALIEQGELPRAAATLEPGGVPDVDLRSPPAALLLRARSSLHLAQGSVVEARDDALALGRVMTEEIGTSSPALMPWRSLAAIAHHRLGAVEEARRLAAEEVELARQFGAARSLGIALRVQGIVEGGPAGMAKLREAVEVLAASPARLECARTLTALGEALGRTGRAEAEEVLGRALEEAERCGATVLAERVRTALRDTGARVPRRRRQDRATLTPTEERVARLVAGGLTNKEVAQQQFVSVRAVEFHLGNVYSKLGISSRRELAAALAGLH